MWSQNLCLCIPLLPSVGIMTEVEEAIVQVYVYEHAMVVMAVLTKCLHFFILMKEFFLEIRKLSFKVETKL